MLTWILGKGAADLFLGEDRDRDEEDEEDGDGVVRESDGVRVLGRAYLCADGFRRATLRNLSNGEGCYEYQISNGLEA